MTATILLNNGAHVLVDDDVHEALGHRRWYFHGGYAVRAGLTRNHSKISMHREIMSAQAGEIVDHINGNTLDNRRANLRLCVARENSFNKRGWAAGYKGVFRSKLSDNWRVIVQCDGKQIYGGSFTSEIAAALAYDRLARQLFGKFARLNLPQCENEAHETEIEAARVVARRSHCMAATAPCASTAE